ncbi:MAG: hypothetical protein LM517_02605 [Nitrosomonas sp.]|nr:hypothetical protein [Nitrosomonas sp.]
MKTLPMILLVLSFVTACISGPSKGQLDDEVRRLCAMDGGIKVYETVKLPAERFDKYGNVDIRSKGYTKQSDEYYLDGETIFLIRGNPRLLRFNSKIIRVIDGKVMGEFIQYARSGGDLPGPWHESSFDCPPLPSKLSSSIFQKEK